MQNVPEKGIPTAKRMSIILISAHSRECANKGGSFEIQGCTEETRCQPFHLSNLI